MGVATADGGYLTKKIIASLSHIRIDYKKDDCGTKFYYEDKLTEDNAKSYYLRYFLDEKTKTLKLLDDDLMKENIGKVLKFRSPMYCIHTELCAKCSGELYRKLGSGYVGIQASKLGSTILQRSLKKTHDLSVKTTTIKNLADVFTKVDIK